MITDYSNDIKQRITPHDLASWFTYHAPITDQQDRYIQLRSKAHELAAMIVAYCPPGADTTAAVRLLRESIMTANAAIACNEG